MPNRLCTELCTADNGADCLGGPIPDTDCPCKCHNLFPWQKCGGSDNEVPTAADPSKRFVPVYYQLGQLPDEADVLDVCAAAGFDVKAYLVVETVHKLLRFRKKGFALKDLNKAIEQLVRLRDIAQAEHDEEVVAQRERNRSKSTKYVPVLVAGRWRCGRGGRDLLGGSLSCPSAVVCQDAGCQR